MNFLVYFPDECWELLAENLSNLKSLEEISINRIHVLSNPIQLKELLKIKTVKKLTIDYDTYYQKISVATYNVLPRLPVIDFDLVFDVVFENLDEIVLIRANQSQWNVLFDVIHQCPNLTVFRADEKRKKLEKLNYLTRMNKMKKEIKKLYPNSIENIGKLMNLNFNFRDYNKRKLEDIY